MRRRIGIAFFLGAVAGLGYLYFDATDFPLAAPIEWVDEALIRRLRESPGTHLALSPAYRLEARLELREDASNRAFFGTEVDLREAVPRRAIHIQRKGGRAAIHADNYNPASGWGMRLLHVTLDVPVIPLVAAALLGLSLIPAWRSSSRGGGRAR
jgi:hypothetical protein